MGERRFCDVEICVGVRGSAHVARVGGGTTRLCAKEALPGQNRGVFGELVRTEWVGGIGAPVVGQEGLQCCGGKVLLGVKGCVTGHEVRVRVMPRTWAGGVKSKQEHTASMQAYRQSCKREGASRQLPSGLSQKGALQC